MICRYASNKALIITKPGKANGHCGREEGTQPPCGVKIPILPKEAGLKPVKRLLVVRGDVTVKEEGKLGPWLP